LCAHGEQILLNSLLSRLLLIDFNDFDDDESTSTAAFVGGNQQETGALEVMTDIAVADSDSRGATGSTDDRVRILEQTSRSLAKTDWRRLAVVLDRFCFIIFAFVMIVTCLAFTGYM